MATMLYHFNTLDNVKEVAFSYVCPLVIKVNIMFYEYILCRILLASMLSTFPKVLQTKLFFNMMQSKNATLLGKLALEMFPFPIPLSLVDILLTINKSNGAINASCCLMVCHLEVWWHENTWALAMQGNSVFCVYKCLWSIPFHSFFGPTT